MNKLVILSGPTAAGKTALSIELAKRINGEIISADSMQVYRHMDIGSAKITPEEMDGVVHHLIDIKEPSESWSVSEFKACADECIKGIYSRGHIPVIVGGTGFYIQSVLYDICFNEEEEDDSIRRALAEYLEQNGAYALHERLRSVDPEAALKIHENNTKRVIRAIEFYEKNGMKISEHNETERAKISPYNFAYFVLTKNREELYAGIDKRVDIMLENGLIEEVKWLKAQGYSKKDVSMQGLGYKEILDYLDGSISLEEAVYILKRDIRHFAKRQITWFKRERDATWFNKSEYSKEQDILDKMLLMLKEKKIYES